MPQVRVNPQGNLDKDTDVAFVNRGNYIDALNIRHRNADGQNFAGVMPIEGNTNAITQVNGSAATTLSYATSTESYRIYIDVTDIANGNTISHEGSLTLSANGFITPSTPYNYASTTAANAYTAITGHLTNLRGIYNALPGVTTLITFTYGSFVNTDPTPGGLTGYFILTSNINEFDLALFNTVGIYAEIEKETEYIATSGTLSIIGSVQLDDDLFVLSAGSVQNGDGTSQVSEVAILYPDGVGYHYKTLIRSKQLRFHKERNAEMEVERLGSQINLYWTDNLNPPRYIELLYANRRTTLGLLISRGGSYQLANVDEESQLILSNTSAYIEDIQVIHGGGSVTAGNKRYTGRFVTDDFTYSDFIYPTNPVNIYNADPAIPYKIAGDDPTIQTSKGVEMVLKNIPQGLYTYFDLVAIEYKGDVFEPVLVQRFRIGENATELKLKHSNRGQTNEKLSPEEVLVITSKYITAKSLKLFDNRMTLSNLTEQIDLNLEAWASSFTHSLETTQIPAVGLIDDVEVVDVNYSFSEYLDPQNTLQFTSYMINDTYRFGVQVQWKRTGKWSAPYWVDDIRFDTLTDNVNSLDDRRTANNINTNLTDATGENVNIYYVRFGNVNLDYLVGGVPIRDLIKTIRFVRAERIPEVIGSGIFLPGVFYSGDVYPFVTTVDDDAVPNFFQPTNYPGVQYLPTGTTNSSRYLYFFSSDFFLNARSYDNPNNTTDFVKILGVPAVKNIFAVKSNTTNDYSTLLETYGSFYTGSQAYYSQQISEHQRINYNFVSTLNTTDVVNSGCIDAETFYLANPVLGASNFNHTGATSENYGVLYGQVFRNLGAHLKYSVDKRQTVYQSTGHYRILKAGENGVITENVFGGDVFNQKTTLHIRRSEGTTGFAFMVSYYSQNVANFQMREILEDVDGQGPGFVFPQYLSSNVAGSYVKLLIGSSLPAISFNATDRYVVSGLAKVLEFDPLLSTQNEYKGSYNYVDGVITENGFDNSSTYDGTKPATIAYSASKTIGSTKNGYRYFQPLNFADLDLTNGEITHHDVINDNFYTFQEKSVQRQYFRDASLINSQSGSDVVVGSGSILGSPGQEITSMGTTKKTSVIKGKNPNGKDTAYWYNDRLQKILRLAGDGVTVISDRGLSSYLLNNGKYISNEFYPLSGRGIHGVWSDKYSEAIFTFKYNDGTNKAFTLVYDEIKNGFVSFHSYTPNIYLPYNNTFFSPNPGAQNTIFLHDGGDNYTFYNIATESYIEVVMNYDPNLPKMFEAIQINSEQIPFSSLNKPVFFNTKNHISYLDNVDFEVREDLFYSSIKNDSTGTGLNDGDTSRLFGRWLKVRIFLGGTGTTTGFLLAADGGFILNNTGGKIIINIPGSGDQKLLNAIVKFRPSPRLYNT